MKTADKPSKTNNREKGGNFIPVLCSVVGTLIILLVVGVAGLLTVPRLLGFQIYNVVSASMEPAIMVGSAVYVMETDPLELEPGEIVAFMDNGSTVTHRVVENYKIPHELVTKGDANEIPDFDPVPYSTVIGRVEYTVPVIGSYMMVVSSTMGKIYMVCFACCGVMFDILGSIIRETAKYRRKSHGHVKTR